MSFTAESEPKVACSALVAGLKGKFVYFMKTIPELGKFLKPLEDAIPFKFVPSITVGYIFSDNVALLLRCFDHSQQDLDYL